MKVLVVFYSMYGHIYRLAEAMAEGARAVAGAQVEMRRVPETLPEEVLKKMGAVDAQKALAHIPVCKIENLLLPMRSFLEPRPGLEICAAK